MVVELVNVSYPSMEPFGEISPLPDIPDEKIEALEAREKAHKEAYEVAKTAYIETYNRRKELFEATSCRLDGCPDLARRGLKFCRRHVGLRKQLKRSVYRALGPGTKVQR